MSQTIDHLIINGPYDKPKKYWLYDRETRLFKLVDGRRPAGYLEASEKKGFDDPGVFQELSLVNKIRKRVEEWVTNGYPGVTGVTKKLLDHWSDKERRDSKFFFASLKLYRL
jgi:type III restriction enzyme